MGRTALLIGLCVAGALRAANDRGSVDAEFAKVPFSDWLEGGVEAQIKWSARAFPPILSVHQRLLTRLEVRVDGAELARRRGQGQLIIFTQLTDAEGAAYQCHGTIELEKVEEGMGASDVTYTQYAFVLPGDYRITYAVYFTATGEHSLKRERFRVAPLKKDPIPEAWRDLPSVEFRADLEPPDLWYLPAVSGRLHLPLATRRPVRLDVIVNLTPTERASGSPGAQGRNLSSLLPAMKAISQIDLNKGSLDVAMLDLSRRRVAFQQQDARVLDWEKMKASLAYTTPPTIDVRSLQDRKHKAQFFVSEVAKRICAPITDGSAPLRVVVVLTSAVAFEGGEDLQPIQAAPGADCRVYYLRFHGSSQRPAMMGSSARSGRYGGGIGLGRRRNASGEGRYGGADIDQLAQTLKPIRPRVFDVTTAEQLRKALAAMLEEIAKA